MAQTWKPAAESLTRDLGGIFRGRLLSIVVYGGQVDGNATAPLQSLALVSSLTAADLEACAHLVADWARGGIGTPLILPDGEFRASLDVFPLEYGEIVRAHTLVYGTDPFDGVSISAGDLRLACEAQAKSHLLHLRQGYVQTGARLPAVARLVAQSAPAFAALLRNVGRLTGVQTADRMEATRQGAKAAGLSLDTVDAILALESPSALPASDPARLFPDYLAAVERLAAVVDRWRAA
ncbi:MAG TPA: hypothetical protein VFO31_16055 [Vicinamibacterales bacterium]|nr:hypothetical protein [Vicinamibacterales bacterium]